MARRHAQWYIDRGRPVPAWSKHHKINDTVGNVTVLPTNNAPVITETDEQIEQRIKDRFAVLSDLVDDVVSGDVTSLIVSGPPGLGKSYLVEDRIKAAEDYRIIKGHASAKALYETLFEHSDEGSILVFDDCDSIFTDEKSLNLLKTALDTTETRVLSWLTSGPFGGEALEGSAPQHFVFKGSIIFITNLDFDGMIAKQNKIAKHLEAIVSRAHYIDLLMKSQRDYIIRIKQVVRDTRMLADMLPHEAADVIKFIEDNTAKLREISLRTALKVATLRKSGKDNWAHIATVTCCKV